MLGPFATASRYIAFTRCRYCRTPPAHRCPQRRRRRQQRQRVTEGTAMAPQNGPNHFTSIKNVFTTMCIFVNQFRGDVFFQSQEYGDAVSTRQRSLDDPHSVAVFQPPHFRHRQTLPSLAVSSDPRYSKSGGPEVQMTSFPVYGALQQLEPTGRLVDELNYQPPSQRFYPEVYRQLQQPFHHLPASDGAIESFPTVLPSFGPYHQPTRCHDDRHYHFRLSSISSSGSAISLSGSIRPSASDAAPAVDGVPTVSNSTRPSYNAHEARCRDNHFRSPSFFTSGSVQRPSGRLQPQPVSATDVTGDIHQQNIISLSSATSGSLDGYHALSILSDIQRGFVL